MIREMERDFMGKFIKGFIPWNKGIGDKICVHCGIKFTPNIRKNRFCSLSCRSQHFTWNKGLKYKNPKVSLHHKLNGIKPPSRKGSIPWNKGKGLGGVQRLYNERRALLFKNAGELTKKTIQQVYEDNIKNCGTLTCYLCLQPIPFGDDHLEHKIPLSRGGSNARDNLDIAHRSCNCKKNNKTEAEYRKGKIK